MPKSDLPFGLTKQNRKELGGLLRCSLPEILSRLESKEKPQRGLALEALAFHLMGLLRLKYVATRLRGTATEGTEADLIFEGSGLIFRRWQIQCRNAAILAADDVAKEVGLLSYFGSDVGMVVATGVIEPKAVEFAKMARRAIRQPLVLIDGKTLRSLADEPSAFGEAIREQAPEALALAD